MNVENEKWVHQTQSLLLKPNAILRLLGAVAIWQLLGLLLGFLVNFGIFILSVAIFFGILWLFPYWQPAYSIIYRNIGDKTISPILEPYHLNLRWWQYISLGIKLAFIVYVLYTGNILLFK